MGRKEPWLALNGTRVFSWTDTVAAQLEERRQRDREAYVQRLADLHCSMVRIMEVEDLCSNP